MESDIIDYRNGKYQGLINLHKQPAGLGIFINDDLTFHISHWQEHTLNGPTLIYLTHGNYIYGEWKCSKPNGLNVYRSGDTVLLSQFKQGLPAERCLIIFERHNIACVLIQEGNEWQILQVRPLPNYKILLKYIQQIGLAVPDHYFSLTKFACAYSHNNKNIKTFPCKANYCYFGFFNGLSIIFDSNNRVVSVGLHKNQQLCQFGGIYDGPKHSLQGNCSPNGQTISHKGTRPAKKIFQNFQNVHKKRTNFNNQYMDSQSKVLARLEIMIRDKLRAITQASMNMQLLKTTNLNDSLTFQEYNEEESIRNYENRQKIYSPPKKSMGNSSSKLQQSSNASKNILSRSNNRSFQTIDHPYVNTQTGKHKLIQPSMPFSEKLIINQEIIKASPLKNQQRRKYQEETFETTVTSKWQDNLEYQQNAQRNNQIQGNVTKKLKSHLNDPYLQHFHFCNQDIASNEYVNKNTIKSTTQKDKPQVPVPKFTSQITKQVYLQNRNQQRDSFQSKQQQDSQSNQHSPTFKGLIEEMDIKCKRNQNIQYQKSSQLPINYIKQSKLNEKEQTVQKINADCNTTKDRPANKNKSHFDIHLLHRPSYEDIEKRKKRILRELQQLNDGPQTQIYKANFHNSSNKGSQQQKESTQISFGFIPLSILNKPNQKNFTPTKKSQMTDQSRKNNAHLPKKIAIQTSGLIQTPLKKGSSSRMQQINQVARFKKLKNSNNHRSSMKQNEENELRLDDPNLQTNNKTIFSHQTSISPSRQKRTYVYMFQQ